MSYGTLSSQPFSFYPAYGYNGSRQDRLYARLGREVTLSQDTIVHENKDQAPERDRQDA